MTRWVIVTPTRDVTLAAHAASRAGVQACSAGDDLLGSIGGAGMTWDLTADITPEEALPELVGAMDAVPLTRVDSRVVVVDGPRVKRTLLLTVRPGTPDQVLARFEADLMGMPDHIPAIRSWSLSRVHGDSRWTHVWEQEFADVNGLVGDYLLHPYHWTHVDRWFDSEVPTAIVHPAIAHLYRQATGPVLM